MRSIRRRYWNCGQQCYTTHQLSPSNLRVHQDRGSQINHAQKSLWSQKLTSWGAPSFLKECGRNDPVSKTFWRRPNSQNPKKHSKLLGFPDLLSQLHPNAVRKIDTILQITENRCQSHGDSRPAKTIHRDQQSS